MIQPLNVLTAACLCLVSFSTLAQVAEPLIIPESARTQRSACAGAMDAGERISISDLKTGTIIDDSQPIILCFGEQILINHNANLSVNLAGDPNTTTTAGIGYVYYDCQPTVTGETSMELRNDRCLIRDPLPTIGDAWIHRGNEEGDAVFHNQGQVQAQFYSGPPEPIWFAPATITNFDSLTFDNGSCLNVRTDQAFSVVYLNEITLDQFSTPDLNSLSGMFMISGGLPEYDGSNYTLSLVKDGDPSVQGIIDANALHGTPTTFSVPQPGAYFLTVSDGEGCSKTFVVNVPNVDPVSLCFGNGGAAPGEQFCVPITVSNFNDIDFMSFAVKWDPRYFEYGGVQNLNTFLEIMHFTEDFVGNGLLKILPLDKADGIGDSLNDGDTLFEICFIAIGKPGDESELTVATYDEGGLDVIFVDPATDELAYIVKPGQLVITLPSSPVLIASEGCPDGSGMISVTLTAYGGTAPYLVEVVDQTTTVIATGNLTEFIPLTVSLSPGDYDLLLNGNSAGFLRLIDEEIEIHSRFENPSCAGQDDGKIVIDSISGGSGDFHVTWIGPGFTRFNDDSLRLLVEGTYQIIATDGNGCSDTADIDLVANGLSLLVSTTRPTCSGQTGSITVDVPGTSGQDYIWEFQNSSGTISRSLTSPSPLNLNNLDPDTYTITMTDGLCDIEETVDLQALKTLTITVDPSTQLTTSCSGDSDGRIDIYVYADTNQTAFQFMWDRVTQDSGFISIDAANSHSYVTGLPAGTYTVTVVDADNCEINQSFTVSEARPLNLDQQALQQYVFQPSCPDGTNGRIDLGFAAQVIGGAPFSGTPYNFRWYDLNNGNNTWLNPSRNFSQLRDLTAGFYGVYVEDANGCSDSTVFELVAGPNVVITLDQENICRGDSVAQLTVSGDLTGNTLMWSTLATTPTISNLKEGIYYVSVTETNAGNTCTVVDSFAIIDPVVPVNVILPMQFAPRSLCNEPDSGIIFNLQIDYPGPKSYIWPTLSDTVTTIPFISVSNSGNYPFTVIDRTTGCIIYDSMVVADFPEKISLDIDSTRVSCYGGNDGEILISASGRSGMFNYSWASGATTPGVTNIPAGIYQVTVTEATDTNCSVPLSINIAQPDTLTLAVDSAFTQDVRCFGDGNGQIGLLWQGGNQDAAPSIVWSAGGVSNTLSATGLDAGTYDIVLTDSKGCAGMATVTLSEPPQLFASVPVPDNPVCNGFQTLITVANANGGTGSNYTFSVDNGPTQMIGSEIPVYAGDHVVTVFDEMGCRVDTMLTIIDPQAITVDLGPDLSVALGDSIRLNAMVDGPSTIDSYLWTPSDLLSCNNCDETFARPFEDQLFELTVVDINGCEGQDQVRVSVDKARLIYIPNGFTPNGDGVNDRWQVYSGPGVRQILGTHVFDRWGNLVFESGQEPAPMGFGSNGWDGRTDTRLMNPGVYVYMVQVEFIDGRIFTYRGDVTMAH